MPQKTGIEEISPTDTKFSKIIEPETDKKQSEFDVSDFSTS